MAANRAANLRQADSRRKWMPTGSAVRLEPVHHQHQRPILPSPKGRVRGGAVGRRLPHFALALFLACSAIGASFQAAWSDPSDPDTRRAREIEDILTTISGFSRDAWTKFDYVFESCEARVLGWTRKNKRLPFERYQKSGKYLFTVKLSGLDVARMKKPESRVNGGVYARCRSATCLFRQGASSVGYRQKSRLAGSLISKDGSSEPGLYVKGRSGAAGKIQRLLVELAEKCSRSRTTPRNPALAQQCFAGAADGTLPENALWLTADGRVLGVGRAVKDGRTDYRIAARPGADRVCVDPRPAIWAFEIRRLSWLEPSRLRLLEDLRQAAAGFSGAVVTGIPLPGLHRALANADFKATYDAFSRSGRLMGNSGSPGGPALSALVLDTPDLAAAAWTAAFLRPGLRRLDELIAFHRQRSERRPGSIHSRPLALWQIDRNYDSAAWIESFFLPAVGYLAAARPEIRVPSRVRRLLAADPGKGPDGVLKAKAMEAARAAVGAGKATEALGTLLPRFSAYTSRVEASRKEWAARKAGVSLATGMAKVAGDALINGEESVLSLVSLVENDYRSDDPEKLFRMARIAGKQGDPLHGHLLCGYARLKALESGWTLQRLLRAHGRCNAMAFEYFRIAKQKEKETRSSRRAIAEMMRNSLAFGNRDSVEERVERYAKAISVAISETRTRLRAKDMRQRYRKEAETLVKRLDFVDLFEAIVFAVAVEQRKRFKSVEQMVDGVLWASLKRLDKGLAREIRRCIKDGGTGWCATLQTESGALRRVLQDRSGTIDIAALEAWLVRFDAELAPRRRALRDHLLALYPSLPRVDVQRRTDRLGDRFSRLIRQGIDIERTRSWTLRAWRHSGDIRTLAFSPDATALLTGSADDSAVLRDVGTGKTLHNWRHEGDVTVAAFSPDGRTVLTASRDGTAVLRDRETGNRLQVWGHGAAGVLAAAFSPDGRYVLTGASDRIADLRETGTGRLRHAWRQSSRVGSVAFSPDGRLAFVRSHRTGAALYRTFSGKRARFWNPSRGLQAIAFSPDGQSLLTGHRSGRVLLQPVGSRRKTLFRWKHRKRVAVVAFSPDGRRILTGAYDGQVALRDIRTGKTLQSWRHERGVRSGAFSPDGRSVAVGTLDGLVALRDVGSGAELRRWQSGSGVTDAAFGADGRQLLTVTARRDATLRDIGTGQTVRQWSNALSAALSPDARTLLIGSSDGTAVLHEIRTGKTLHRWRHTRGVSAVAFSPGGNIVLTGSWDDTAALRDVRTGKTLHSWRHSRTGVTAAGFSPDGASVWTVSTDRKVAMRSWKSGGIGGILGRAGHVTAIALSPNGQHVLIGSADNTAVAWNPRERKLLHKWKHGGDVTAVAFSPDGRHALTASRDKTAMLRAVDSGRTVWKWLHTEAVTVAAFSPDGRYVLTGSKDDTAVLRDARTGKSVHTWRHEDDVTAIAFSPDGRYALTGSRDDTAVLRNNRTGKAERTWRSNRDVDAFAFSPDGRWIAVAWGNGIAALYANPGIAGGSTGRK